MFGVIVGLMVLVVVSHVSANFIGDDDCGIFELLVLVSGSKAVVVMMR